MPRSDPIDYPDDHNPPENCHTDMPWISKAKFCDLPMRVEESRKLINEERADN